MAPKRLHFRGMVPAANAENDAAVSKNVGRRESSASRSGCHIGVILKPQPILDAW